MPTLRAYNPLPSHATMVRNIVRDYETAIAAGFGEHADWYRGHHESMAALAQDTGVPLATIAAMAANVSPGLDPAREAAYIAWIIGCVRNGEDPGPENRPHGYGVPRGYAPMVRAAETYRGERAMPDADCKTGNYARCILNPDDPELPCAHDVHAHRTACGDPLTNQRGNVRELPSLTPKNYRAALRAWRAAARKVGRTPMEVQAVCWVFRRSA